MAERKHKYIYQMMAGILKTNFYEMTTHLNLQYMFWSPNDHLQLKVELN